MTFAVPKNMSSIIRDASTHEAAPTRLSELMGWMPPSGRHRKVPTSASEARSKEEPMSDVHVLAIDLAKRSFQVCATDRGGACVDAPGIARGFF